MKKSLVLAMAMALGVTASAYAANPFSDVPAGHWAYDSISKLAAAGVVEGYPDGSFKGDNLMTRYEMAQIVAKAMAKGANVDALAAEFADELDNLGVRVAALEKKADNVKITGQIRYTYSTMKTAARKTNEENDLRTRLWISGQINEDWTYTGMLQHSHVFGNFDNEQNTGILFRRAYVDGKLGGLKVRAGRISQSGFDAGAAIVDSTIMSPHMDGVKVEYGKDIKLTGLVGKLDGAAAERHIQVANIAAPVAKNITMNVGMYNVSNFNGAGTDDNTIWNVGAKANLGKSVLFTADWFKGDDVVANQDDDGIALGLQYKGASAAKPGSYGIFAKYYKMGTNSYIANPNDIYGAAGDYKGYWVGANYAFAKNIVGQVHYAEMKDQDTSAKTKTLWSQVVFTF